MLFSSLVFLWLFLPLVLILYRLLPADEKDRLTSNFTAATADVPEPIRIRAIARFYQADEHCGKEMARKTQTDLKKILEEVKRQQALESR